MSSEEKSFYRALNQDAQDVLELRNYHAKTFEERLRTSGVEAGELVARGDNKEGWIPGVEVFSRKVFHQRHRGHFGELARLNEGILDNIGLSPKQWASAMMLPQTGKGFHIHPPHLSEGTDAAQWFKRLFLEHPEDYSQRPYSKEQWDVMFFVQGNVEIFLVDERAGLERRRMRFIIDGDGQGDGIKNRSSA